MSNLRAVPFGCLQLESVAFAGTIGALQPAQSGAAGHRQLSELHRPFKHTKVAVLGLLGTYGGAHASGVHGG